MKESYWRKQQSNDSLIKAHSVCVLDKQTDTHKLRMAEFSVIFRVQYTLYSYHHISAFLGQQKNKHFSH